MNGFVWEVKLRSGESFAEAKAESIEFDGKLANFKVLITPKKTETRRWWFFAWTETVAEAVYQVMLSVPIDNIAYIRLKQEEEKKK